MSGIVKLGAPGDLRTYTLAERTRATIQWVRSQANPFANKLNTEARFDRVDDWSEFVMQDWQAGRGKRDPEAGGFLYAQSDTRFPRQFFLPHYAEPASHNDEPNGGALYADHLITVDGDPITNAAYSFTLTADRTVRIAWIHLLPVGEGNLTVGIYSDDGDGLPDTELTFGIAPIAPNRPGGLWVEVPLEAELLSADTLYHVVVSADTTFELPAVSLQTLDNQVMRGSVSHDNGSTWSGEDFGFQFTLRTRTGDSFLGLQDGSGQLLIQDESGSFILNTFPDMVRSFAIVKNRVYMAAGTKVFVWTESTREWDEIHDTGNELVSDLVRVDEELYIAHGSAYQRYNPDTDSVTQVTLLVEKFLLAGGFLFRSTGTQLFYTANLTNWVGPFTFGVDGRIRGMAILEDEVYVSTDRGLFMLARGDIELPVMPWPTIDERNGVGMVEWNGSLYIPLAEDVVMYNATGQLQGIGLKRGEELPIDVQGQVVELLPTTYFLLAIVDPGLRDAQPTLWSFNDEGWHNIVQLPYGVGGGGMLLDTTNRKLWIGGNGMTFRTTYPSSVINPTRERLPMSFARYGWLETDKFFGGNDLLDKDFDGVFLSTEFLGPDGYMEVYWQDEDTASSDVWNFHARYTCGCVERRFAIDDRPQGKYIKLGILLYTHNLEQTPIVETVITRFMPMVNDRFRWNIAIPVHDNQQMPSGLGLNAQSAVAMKEHLNSLVHRIQPFIFEDINGVQYEVKLQDHNLQAEEYEHYDNGNQAKWLYNLNLIQVADEPYES